MGAAVRSSAPGRRRLTGLRQLTGNTPPAPGTRLATETSSSSGVEHGLADVGAEKERPVRAGVRRKSGWIVCGRRLRVLPWRDGTRGGHALKGTTMAAMALLFAMSSQARAQARADEALAKSAGFYLRMTYAWQKYTGGLSQFQSAKSLAVDIITELYGDRNSSVQEVNRMEKALQSGNSVESLKRQFDEHKLSDSNRAKACDQLVKEARDQVQAARARVRTR